MDEKLTPRQEKLFAVLYDPLQTFRFTKISDPNSKQHLFEIVQKIDAVIEDELAAMDILVRDPKTGRIGKYQPIGAAQ